KEWKRELASAKNYVTTPDFKSWTFGKSAGINNEYHADGGAAKIWLYSNGFVDVLKLPNGNFKAKAINGFLNWATSVKAFDIVGKFKKDQENNKHFEILVHSTILPDSLLRKINIAILNQESFDEGFKKEIIKEVSSRNKSVIELAKNRYGTRCTACGFDFGIYYGAHGKGFIEMHHLYPLNLGKRETRAKDLRPVCANCHRMLHKGKRLLTIEELKLIIRKAKKSQEG
ncbi:MAG: hypothetical protein DI539_27850, partial [Flavobacterium psychrophilum]